MINTWGGFEMRDIFDTSTFCPQKSHLKSFITSPKAYRLKDYERFFEFFTSSDIEWKFYYIFFAFLQLWHLNRLAVFPV